MKALVGPDRRPWRRPLRSARAWRKDETFRRQLKNVGHLLTGNFAASLIGLASFALTARALGPADYGVIALMHAYTRVINKFVNFQSWQPLIKYGAEAQSRGAIDDLKALLKFGLVLDLGAAVLGWALAVAIALLAQPWFGWRPDTVLALVVYCTVMLFNLSGMPTAVMRLSGRYRLMALGQVFSASCRLVLCAAGWVMGAGLWFFVLVWMGVQAVSSACMLVFALRELRRQGCAGFLSAPVRGIRQRFPGLWSFAWLANLSLTIRTSTHEVDTLLVGALADTTAAGFYHIAKRLGRMALQVGVQVQSVVYPDLARLWASGTLGQFRRALRQATVILTAFGALGFLIVLAGAEPLLRWTAGPAFVAAAPLLVVQMLAVSVSLAGISLRTAMLVMGLQRQLLYVVLAATAAFYLTALLLLPSWGAMGANIAHLVLSLIWIAGMAVILARAIAWRRASAGTAQPAGSPSAPSP